MCVFNKSHEFSQFIGSFFASFQMENLVEKKNYFKTIIFIRLEIFVRLHETCVGNTFIRKSDNEQKKKNNNCTAFATFNIQNEYYNHFNFRVLFFKALNEKVICL